MNIEKRNKIILNLFNKRFKRIPNEYDWDIHLLFTRYKLIVGIGDKNIYYDDAIYNMLNCYFNISKDEFKKIIKEWVEDKFQIKIIDVYD